MSSYTAEVWQSGLLCWRWELPARGGVYHGTAWSRRSAIRQASRQADRLRREDNAERVSLA